MKLIPQSQGGSSCGPDAFPQPWRRLLLNDQRVHGNWHFCDTYIMLIEQNSNKGILTYYFHLASFESGTGISSNGKINKSIP